MMAFSPLSSLLTLVTYGLRSDRFYQTHNQFWNFQKLEFWYGKANFVKIFKKFYQFFRGFLRPFPHKMLGHFYEIVKLI